VPYGITQCYLPPGRGDVLALTLAKAGTRLSDPGGCKAGGDISSYYPRCDTLLEKMLRLVLNRDFFRLRSAKHAACLVL